MRRILINKIIIYLLCLYIASIVSVCYAKDIFDVVNVRILEGNKYSHFGRNMEAGDYNNDGFIDIAISAEDEDDPKGVLCLGAVYIFYGPLTDSVLSNKLDKAHILAYEGGRYFGAFMDSGDLNGDGIDDLVISSVDNFYQTYNPEPKSCFIIFGEDNLKWGTSGQVIDVTNLNHTALHFNANLPQVHPVVLGDVNGDGINDLGFSWDNQFYYFLFEDIHEAYLVLGRKFWKPYYYWERDNFPYDFQDGHTGDIFPIAISLLHDSEGTPIFWAKDTLIHGLGDVNNDGFSDILIGAKSSFQIYNPDGAPLFPEKKYASFIKFGKQYFTTLELINNFNFDKAIIESPGIKSKLRGYKLDDAYKDGLQDFMLLYLWDTTGKANKAYILHGLNDSDWPNYIKLGDFKKNIIGNGIELTSDVEIADVNKDNSLDLIFIGDNPALNSNQVSVFLGKEKGFSKTLSFLDGDFLWSAADSPYVPYQEDWQYWMDHRSIDKCLVADLNGGGINDLMVSEGMLSIVHILLGNSDYENLPPKLVKIFNYSVYEGDNLKFKVNAEDPDSNILFFSASNLPPGAKFDPETQIFDWTPSYDQGGKPYIDYTNISIEVADGFQKDYKEFYIRVRDKTGGDFFEDFEYGPEDKYHHRMLEEHGWYIAPGYNKKLVSVVKVKDNHILSMAGELHKKSAKNLYLTIQYPKKPYPIERGILSFWIKKGNSKYSYYNGYIVAKDKNNMPYHISFSPFPGTNSRCELFGERYIDIYLDNGFKDGNWDNVQINVPALMNYWFHAEFSHINKIRFKGSCYIDNVRLTK